MRRITPESALIFVSVLFAVTTVTLMERPQARAHEATAVVTPDRPSASAAPFVPVAPSTARHIRA